MKVTKAMVVLGTGMDTVVLHTTFPAPVPSVSTEPLVVMFHAEYDRGKEYVLANWPGIEVDVIPRISRTGQ